MKQQYFVVMGVVGDYANNRFCMGIQVEVLEGSSASYTATSILKECAKEYNAPGRIKEITWEKVAVYVLTRIN